MANSETIEEIDTLLQSYERFGVHLGLEASVKLLADLGNPQEQVPVVHIAGSNGKGSVCAYVSTILTEAGYKTGRYTSPHLIDWTERICVNNRSIEPEALYQTLLKVQSKTDPNCSPTQFEILTAAMWLYFAEQHIDIAVIEVGLGGRLDATNVIEHPLVSVIVSISREHWQRLGFTLSSIAREKAGILKPSCPAVIGQLPSEAKAEIDLRIADLNCTAVYPKPSRLVDGWAYQGSLKYKLPLQGEIQLYNSALAIAAVESLRQQNWNIPDSAIINGIENTKWIGRLQWYGWKNYQILIDGAHNPASAEVLRQYIDQIGKTPVQWVIGMLSTKDHADIFKALLRSQDALFLVPVPGHRSAAPTELATIAQEICPTLTACQIYPDVFAALDRTVEQSQLTVLCGSLYLIGDFFKQQKAS